MFKVCAHTMSTPQLEIEEAVPFIAQLGFEGIEIVCSDDYKCALPLKPSQEQLNDLKALAEDHNLAIADIVPYAKEFNSLINERRRRAIDEIKRVIDIADFLYCPSVRILAGEDATEQFPTSLELLIESLIEIAEYLSNTEITANIENHVTTEAISAEKTVEIVRLVRSNHIGIIYDPANLIVLGDQDCKKTYQIQAPFINHIHLKDLILIDDVPTPQVIGGRTIEFPPYHPQQFGKGQIPLEKILGFIVKDAYKGFVSVEYEKRWHPQLLPDPEVALPQELAFLDQFRQTN